VCSDSVVHGTTHGFNWKDGGKSVSAWWSDSTSPGASLTLDISTQTMDAHRGNSTEPHDVTIAIGFLRSGTKPMGRAAVECVSCCSCERKVLHGDTDSRTSQSYLEAMLVSAHPHCNLQITVRCV
jgi:hypothetical protein